jgi:hypothetical protein
LTGGGALSSDLTLAIPQASGSVNGYLGSADFATFNAKQNAITLTTTGTSGAATLVGSTLNIPNYADTDTGITSLNGLTALTQTFAVGTSGTDFGISSATSTHTFNLPTASAANRGALSSADWTTFNNKLNLSGGTLTGALEINNNALTQDGTRPIFTLKQSGTSKLLLGIASEASDIIVGDAAGDVDFRTNSQAFNFSVNNGGSIAFKLASNAAATFSSSVTASSLIKSGGTSSQYLMADGSTSTLTNPITGTGTTNYLPKFTGASALGNSLIFDNGSNVYLNASSGTYRFEANAGTSQYLNARFYGSSHSLIQVESTTATFQALLSFKSPTRTWSTGLQGDGRFSIYDNTANAERFTILSSGFTGIGTTTPAFTLDVNSGSVGTASARFKYGIVNNRDFQGYNNGIIFQTAGTSNWYIGSSANGSNTEMQIYNSALSAVVLNFSNATGAATFSAGLSLSGATAPASGIQFPATQVASASANNLDDYEEGTWTMGVSFGGASVGVTYSANTGTYTKIGRQVTVNGFVFLSSKGSSIGSAKITGLPFNIGNTLGNYNATSLRFENISFTNQFQGFGEVPTTNIVLEQITVLGTSSPITDANFANNSTVLISATYFV